MPTCIEEISPIQNYILEDSVVALLDDPKMDFNHFLEFGASDRPDTTYDSAYCS